ncbi:DNA repair protein RadA [Synechococcus sp. M16CYN]
MASLENRPLQRLATGLVEFDRVLGSGLVPGSLVLVGGNPGIGKSTLLLQSASAMAAYTSVLYVSAEESAQQVKLRWQRLAGETSDLRLLTETDFGLVLQELEALRPAVAIIDSIQALHNSSLTSAPGSVGQVRECAASLQRLAKRQNTALLLVGHVTKEGMLAGPKVLEHLVDVVLAFEGDQFASHRLLRATKNRFGATHELGLFEMQAQGLAEVVNPSELFLSGARASGVATIVTYEGTRSLVVDLQALVNVTSYASPRRTATGIGINRLHQILAVLEKHMGLPLSRFDCYLAVAGGLKVEEPAADLGVAAAVVASFRDLTLPPDTVLIGELGLGGQLRPVSRLELRLQEAARLGFQQAVVPSGSGLAKLIVEMNLNLVLLEATNITEALVLVFGNEVRVDQK